MIEIEAPDGTIVEFPEGTSDAVINQAMQKAYGYDGPQISNLQGKQDREDYSLAADIGNSALTGLRSGVEGMVGMLGDVNQLGVSAAEALGAPPELAQYARFLSPFPNAMSTDQIRQNVTNPVMGEPVQPQSVAGDYIRTAAEFAPAAVAGPGGMLRKAAMTAIPAITSETAGQITRDTSAEPYARVAGGLVGGAASAGKLSQPASAARAASRAAKNAPSEAKLAADTNAKYQRLRDAGVSYDANQYTQFLTQLEKEIPQKFKRSIYEPVLKVLDDIVKDKGKAPDFDDIDGWISQIGEAARDASASGDKRLSRGFNILQNRFRAFEKNAKFSVAQPMAPNEKSKLVRDARQLALRRIKDRELSNLKVNSEFYRSGEEAGMRRQVNNFLKSKRGKQLFKPGTAEHEALKNVAQGRAPLEILSKFGFSLENNRGQGALVPALTAAATGGASVATGGVLPLALPVAGSVAKSVSPRMTNNAFENVRRAVRSGGLTDDAMKAARGDVVVRNAANLQPSSRQGRGQPVELTARNDPGREEYLRQILEMQR